MADAEKVIRHIVGNVGGDPVERDGEYGKWATFSVAVTRSYPDRDAGEQYGESRWYSVSVSREALVEDVMANIKKGSKVAAEGIPTVVDRDGQKFYNFKAYRVGTIDYLGFTDAPVTGGDVIEDDDDI
jgi:single-stranded DNA-binding protein